MISSLAYAVLCVSAAAPVSAAQETGGVFQSMTFEEALEESKETDRLLVVDVAFPGYAPWERMNRTTWQDGRVTSWIKKNGIAIRQSVEASRKRSGFFWPPILHMRPTQRPIPPAAIEGQTVITVTSPNSSGATPAMACFMELRWVGNWVW